MNQSAIFEELGRRHNQFTRGLPEILAEPYAEYRSRHELNLTSAEVVEPTTSRPFWLSWPPKLLRTLWCDQLPRIEIDLLTDVLWSQGCMVYAIRLHDDLFDKQSSQRELIYIGDLLATEAERTLANCSQQIPEVGELFRTAFWRCIVGIVETYRLQKLENIESSKQRTQIERVSALFPLSSIVMLGRAGRSELVDDINSASNTLSVAGQLVDDFYDLEEDASAGLINFAARLILKADGLSSNGDDQVSDRIAVALSRSESVDRACAPFVERLTALENRLAEIGLSCLIEDVVAIRESLEAIATFPSFFRRVSVSARLLSKKAGRLDST
jgi:hypothetical protein